MALAALATVADLESRGVTVDAAEEPIVGVYLDVASAAVRDAAGSPISETTSTVTLEGAPGVWLRLPGAPVTAVDTVTLDGTAVTDWRLTSGRLWRAGGWGAGAGPSQVTVAYTHGLPAVPADVVDLVCRMAATALTSYRNGATSTTRPIVSERIGDYSVTYAYEDLFTEADLPDYVRARLAARFGGGVGLVRSR